jgi:transposase
VAWLKRGARALVRSLELGVPATVSFHNLKRQEEGIPVAAVMIGVDPHKASHTAVAINAAEEPLGQLRVRASAAQAERLVVWAQAWPERAWAVEGAGGVGHLLAQQLLAAGERVLDVPPKLAARVRLLAAGDINKNDPNDARSVAVAALRSADIREAQRDDHAVVLKVWSKRYRDLGRARTQVACRLHQVLCELIPGGVPGEITAGQAGQILSSITPADAVAAARWELAAELVEDLRGTDTRIRETRKKAAIAVRAAGTSLTGLFGIGPVIAAIVIGDVRHVSRFPRRDHFAAYNGTAPVEVSSGGRKIYRLSRRGNRRLNHAIHMAAVTQIRYRHSEGRAYYDKKRAEGKTPKEALRALKRQISDAIFACLQADAKRAAAGAAKSPGGQPGNGSGSSAAGSHPGHRLFGQATPGPATHPTTPAAPFPASLPSRASGRPGQGPGGARPRSGGRRASLKRPPGSR